MILSLCLNPSIDSYAHIKGFEPGSVNRIESLKEYPGGKGVHVAMALAELGANSRLLGFWSGAAGEWIKNQCEALKVASNGVSVSGNNRKCYTFISENSALHHTELLEPGPTLSVNDFENFLEVFQNESAKSDFVCISGSCPKNAPEDAYAQLIRIAKQQQKKVILDCTGIQLEKALEEGFFGIHLNHIEAKSLCGSSKIEDLQEFFGDKVQLIALTRGSEGLELAYENKIIKSQIKLPREEIISTVGSGDCLTAGIAFALHKQLKHSEIAAWGAACGTANCLNEDLGMLKKEDVERMLKKVQIKTYE
ncbi:1-phosphofructokinase family hexose kinase [Salegentibacter maritimus]|uniref:1-phosphofructokinase family hexose kinase n=1 Tax=Salegentibacter maritimus TaxID=2794347 RepID=UPI0018E4A35C|nr:1-phosphofructokinase family hexose kinase [Salegentibacter maritimus]MBI6116819.1 1-phosphofructokinase family hexose kinase [Salegentibacter maritimus]